MTRPALVNIGIGAVLAIGLSSCGTATSGEAPDDQTGESTQYAADATTPPSPAQEATATANEDTTTPSTNTQEDDAANTSSSTSTGTSPSHTPSIPTEGPVDGVGISQGANFGPYTDQAMAITYNTDLVPKGSTIRLTRTHGVDETRLSVQVIGLEPNREFGAHVHMNTCGKTPSVAGAAYRNEPKASGSMSEGPVDTDNEIWFDLKTGSQGTAEAGTAVDWSIRPAEGLSLILHSENADGGSQAGEPGERVACFVLGGT